MAVPPAPAQLPPPVAVKAEPLTTLPPPPPRAHIPAMNPAATSMSRRNLETIVEAIRHLEGDSALFDACKKSEGSRNLPPHSEGESEREGSMYSDEENKSESSGRDSPPLFKPHHTTATATVHVRHHNTSNSSSTPSHHPHQHHVAASGSAIPLHVNGVTVTGVAVTAAPHTQFVTSSEQRYPIATQLLHRPTAALQQQQQQQQPFTVHRPGVIVHNLS